MIQVRDLQMNRTRKVGDIHRIFALLVQKELQVKRIVEEIFALRQEKDISQNQYVALKEQEGQFNITLSILEENSIELI
jgi:hypothetical protein